MWPLHWQVDSLLLGHHGTPEIHFDLEFSLMFYFQFSSVQSLSRVWLFATPWIAVHQASLSITNSRSSLRLTSIESVIPSSHLILCPPLLLLPPIPPSIRLFSNESTFRMRWPKYWSFSFSIIPCKEIPGLISFRMDSLDLLAVQGSLKSLFQHHSSKASILRRSAFFTICENKGERNPENWAPQRFPCLFLQGWRLLVFLIAPGSLPRVFWSDSSGSPSSSLWADKQVKSTPGEGRQMEGSHLPPTCTRALWQVAFLKNYPRDSGEGKLTSSQSAVTAEGKGSRRTGTEVVSPLTPL